MKTDKHKLFSAHSLKLILVYLCGFVFFFVLIGVGQPVRAGSASLYLLPSSGSYLTEEVFSVGVFFKTEKIAINAAQATVKFPAEKLEVVNLSKSGSVFTIWFQEPVFSNSKGEISFLGGLLSPGYIGEKGNIITITFRAKSEGQVSVFFEQEAISANDPQGTNVFSFSQGGNFIILPESEEILKIDKESPHPFEVMVDNEGDQTNPQPFLFFETTDELSGISHYEIKIGQEDFFRVSLEQTKPFQLAPLAPGNYQITVRAYDKAGNYTDSQAKLKIESIAVPKITVCPKTYYAGQEVLYLGGAALPDHIVAIYLKTAEGKLVKSWEVSSDQRGDWFLEEESLFIPGEYKILAKAKDDRGAISDFSQECSVKIFLSGLVVGSWIIDYKILTLFFLIILLLVSFAAFYLFLKIKKTQKIIDRETKDLKEKFYQEYRELCQDIEKELAALKNLRGEREMTREEKSREEELLKNLADVKEVFEKELKDIEDLSV